MKVNLEKGYINPVSLIKKGMSLNGVMVDDVTIEQMYNEIKDTGVPVFLTHAEDIANRDPSEMVAKITGVYKDADGLYGSCQFLKSFINGENSKQKYQTLMEVAQNDPTHYGFSMSFFGPREDTKDGKAYRAALVASCDLVAVAAANPQGLLSVEVQKEEIITIAEEVKVQPTFEILKQQLAEQVKSNKLNMKIETYNKYKDRPELLAKAVKLSMEDGMVDETIIETIEDALEEAAQIALITERDALKAKVVELELAVADLTSKLGESTKTATEATTQVESLSLKVSEYEKKKGASPINVGVNQGEKLSIKQKMESLPTFSEQLAFYRQHKEEIDSSK